MKKNTIYFIVFLGLFLIACTDGKNTNNNKQVFLPNQLNLYTPFTTIDSASAFERNFDHKIYTLIDASCSSCFEKFKKWDVFQRNIDTFKNTKVVAICHSKDSFELVKYLFENDKIKKVNYPIFLDLTNEFKKANSSLIQNPLKFAVLTDYDNKVLLIGDPINNEKDKKLFLDKIRSISSVSK